VRKVVLSAVVTVLGSCGITEQCSIVLIVVSVCVCACVGVHVRICMKVKNVVIEIVHCM